MNLASLSYPVGSIYAKSIPISLNWVSSQIQSRGVPGPPSSPKSPWKFNANFLQFYIDTYKENIKFRNSGYKLWFGIHMKVAAVFEIDCFEQNLQFFSHVESGSLNQKRSAFFTNSDTLNTNPEFVFCRFSRSYFDSWLSSMRPFSQFCNYVP